MSTPVTDVQDVPLYITAGCCFNPIFTFSSGGVAYDVSDWEFDLQIRELYDSSEILAEMTFDRIGLLISQVRGNLTAEQTGELPIVASENPGRKKSNRLSYDLKVKIDGCWYLIQQGPVYVNPLVSRE